MSIFVGEKMFEKLIQLEERINKLSKKLEEATEEKEVELGGPGSGRRPGGGKGKAPAAPKSPRAKAAAPKNAGPKKAPISKNEASSRIEKMDSELSNSLGAAGLPPAPVKVMGVSPAMSQVENGKTVEYPETIEVNIEARSTGKYSVRTSDNKWIPEGTELSGPGLTKEQVFAKVKAEQQEWKNSMAKK